MSYPLLATHCSQPEDKSALGFKTYINGTTEIQFWNTHSIELDWFLRYLCEDPKVLDTNPNEKKIDVKCLQNGSYEYPTSWPNCVAPIKCGLPDHSHVINGHRVKPFWPEKKFAKNETVEWVDAFALPLISPDNATLEGIFDGFRYQCDTYFEFSDGNASQERTCYDMNQWTDITETCVREWKQLWLETFGP